jgi:hypothetical protein
MRYVYAAAAAAAVVAGAFAYVRAAADESTGYTGKGQLVVQTSIGGPDNKITIGGDIALEERGSQLRIDVLSLGIPGMSATISTLVSTQLLPLGGFTVVYDRKAATYTVWSSAKRVYYSSASGAAQNGPVTGAAVAVVGANDLFSAFSFARSLKDDAAFTLSLGLAGHQTINGHPATGLNFQYARTTKTGDALEMHGTFEFADDLDDVPVEISVAAKSKMIPDSALRLDFSSLVKQTPPDADFDVPAGYTRASGLGDVIGKALPGM